MPDLPEDIKRQFETVDVFPSDLVRPVVVAWSMLKKLEEAAAPEAMLDEERRLLVERLDALEAWSKNFCLEPPK